MTATKEAKEPMTITQEPIANLDWRTIHPSVIHDSAGPLRSTASMLRPSGALRYCCPVTGSFVLITDEAALARLAQPRVRLRCVDCGEMHLLKQNIADNPDDIVASPAKP